MQPKSARKVGSPTKAESLGHPSLSFPGTQEANGTWFLIWKPTVGWVEDAAGTHEPATGSRLPYLPEKRAQNLNDQLREAFANKHSLPQKGVSHLLGDSTGSSGMLCVWAHLL